MSAAKKKTRKTAAKGSVAKKKTRRAAAKGGTANTKSGKPAATAKQPERTAAPALPRGSTDYAKRPAPMDAVFSGTPISGRDFYGGQKTPLQNRLTK